MSALCDSIVAGRGVRHHPRGRDARRARGVAAVEHEHVVVGQVRHGRAQRAKQAGAARRQGLGVTRGHENDRRAARARRVADRVPGVDRSDVGTIVARRPRRRDIRRARRRGRARDERQAPQRGRRGPASHHRPGCSAARFGARTWQWRRALVSEPPKYLSGAEGVTTRRVEQLCSLADNVTATRGGDVGLSESGATRDHQAHGARAADYGRHKRRRGQGRLRHRAGARQPRVAPFASTDEVMPFLVFDFSDAYSFLQFADASSPSTRPQYKRRR